MDTDDKATIRNVMSMERVARVWLLKGKDDVGTIRFKHS